MNNELALRPTCHRCGISLEIRRPYGGTTAEQQWCGVWYDHPRIPGQTDLLGHAGSLLLPSQALIEQQRSYAAA